MIRASLVALVSLALAGVSGPHQISRSGRGAYEASLTAYGSGLVVSWYDDRDGQAEIYARFLDDQGRPIRQELRLTDGKSDAYEPDIQAAAANLAVAWYEKKPTDGSMSARLGLWSRDGRAVWTITLSSAGSNGRNAVVRVAGDALFCAWLESVEGAVPELWAGWFSTAGKALAPARRIAPASTTTWNLNAAVDRNGTAWVVYDSANGTRSQEIFLARIGRTSTDVTRLTADDGAASAYPDLAFDRTGAAALTWFDERDGNKEVYLFAGSTDEMTTRLETRGQRITNTPGESIGAYVTWRGDRVGLAWSDDTFGQHEIYYQVFDRDARALRAAERVTDNATESLIPAIRATKDGFALAWNEFAPGPMGVHAPGGRSQVVVGVVPDVEVTAERRAGSGR